MLDVRRVGFESRPGINLPGFEPGPAWSRYKNRLTLALTFTRAGISVFVSFSLGSQTTAITVREAQLDRNWQLGQTWLLPTIIQPVSGFNP